MPINRGRKSAEEIAIEQIADVVRPEPPKNLDDDEAKVWREVVDRMPPNWFPRETHGLLAQYCKHEAAVVFID